MNITFPIRSSRKRMSIMINTNSNNMVDRVIDLSTCIRYSVCCKSEVQR